MITYREFKDKRKKYYLYVDDNNYGSASISAYVGISYEELIKIIQQSKGVYSSKLGWYFFKEEDAIQCSVLLSLIKK